MTEPEVDMSDYRLNVDTDVEDGDDLEPLDFGEDVIDNDKFLSGSESDENETSDRKNILHSIRRSNENMLNFYLGQVFGRKEEAKKLIRQHAVESRSQQKSKNKKEKGKGAEKEKGKSKGASGNKKRKGKGLVGTRAEPHDGGRGKRTQSHAYQCPWVLFLSKMLEQIEENPNIPVKAVQDQFRRKYGVSVHKMKAYRAKMKAKRKVEGDYKQQYSFLRDYAAELVDKNPALDKNLIGLDGAFMKGIFPGQMLTAVGLDSNNGIYPVCYAIVESESFSSWTWQKGIFQAIQTLFPCAEHRYCLRHIHENMKLAGYRGVLYKNMLYKCATSTTKLEFLTAMNELKEFNKEAHLWLPKITPQSWSRSHYSGLAISDVMINNICEVYNGKIVEARDRPIISALEYVREYLMRRIVTVLGIIDKYEGLLTPRATQMFEAIQKQANHYSVQWNGGDLYEVSGKPTDPYVVNLAMRTCSCKGWEITGMPCRHAVAALWFMAANGGRVGALESWVHAVHTMDRWKLVYSFKVNPINGMTLWTKCEAPTTIVAPKHHTMAGRPKKARKRSVVEKDDIPATGKLTRKNTFGACSRCGSTGHNVRTCTGPLKKKGKKAA
ncbi:uncharacterized protein LOC143592874 [Bidens hawaiensis]|uniref:uncharacterized protein LOC143592874 n=1 Tax=Bidens hawaiensis TaxID=980011 RepID=UPI00404971D5